MTYSYVVTNTSTGSTDPLTITSLVDDNGTPANLADDVNLLTSGSFSGGDTNANGQVDLGESWTWTYTTTIAAGNAGTGLTNIATVTGGDDESTSVSDDDDATVTPLQQRDAGDQRGEDRQPDVGHRGRVGHAECDLHLRRDQHQHG